MTGAAQHLEVASPTMVFTADIRPLVDFRAFGTVWIFASVGVAVVISNPRMYG
jgi:hypothetical protein